MNASANLYITGKGEDEIAHRTYKLGIQYRSILLLLGKPQTLESLLRKSAFPIGETTDLIKQLLQEGFIAHEAQSPNSSRSSSARPGFIAHEAQSAMTNTGHPSVHTSASGDSEWDIDGNIDIFLPEARFLLADFCMDCFGVHAQSLIDGIRACKTVPALSSQIKELAGQLSQKRPEQLPRLRKIVREIIDAAS